MKMNEKSGMFASFNTQYNSIMLDKPSGSCTKSVDSPNVIEAVVSIRDIPTGIVYRDETCCGA